MGLKGRRNGSKQLSSNPLVAFVGGFLGGLVSFLLVFQGLLRWMGQRGFSLPSFVWDSGTGPAAGSDVLATANTFIVFTTIIFVVATIFLTALALYFGWQFSHDKEQQFADRMAELRAVIRQNGLAAKGLIEAALENDEGSAELMQRVRTAVDSLLQEAVKRGQQEPQVLQVLQDALNAASERKSDHE